MFRTQMISATALALSLASPTFAQTVLSGSHVIDGDLCVGGSCGAGETFDATVNLKLKASLLDVDFIDTSGDTFPDRDWRLLVNDGGSISSGGIERFSIQDMTEGTTPFTLEGAAPTNSLYINPHGDIGLGTQSPAANLHIVDGNSPELRLEQDGSGGNTPMNWRLLTTPQGQLMLRDGVNNNIHLLFTPGAGADQRLRFDDDGMIQLHSSAYASPAQARFHMMFNDGTAKMRIDEYSSTTSPRTLLELQNNGRPEIVMGNTATGQGWSFGAGTNFVLKQGGNNLPSSSRTKLFEVKPSGDATLTGTLTTGGTTCGGGCDRVFTEQAIIPARDYAAAMWRQGHLPHVGPTLEGAPINVSEKLGGMLNALEHAHVFIDRQAAEIEAQAAQLAAQEARLARQDQRLAELEAVLADLLN